MTDTGAPSSSQRSGSRTATTMMLAKLSSATGDTLCRVRNLSEGGMMIEAAGVYTPGDAVSLQLRNGVSVAGKVVWARDGRIGLQFAQALRVAELLAPPPKPVSRIRRTRTPRPARFDVRISVTIEDSHGSHRAELRDISQGGARLRLQSTVMPRLGETVLISIPELGDKRAIVRWAGAELGLNFVAPLTFEALSPWLSARALKSDQPV